MYLKQIYYVMSNIIRRKRDRDMYVNLIQDNIMLLYSRIFVPFNGQFALVSYIYFMIMYSPK